MVSFVTVIRQPSLLKTEARRYAFLAILYVVAAQSGFGQSATIRVTARDWESDAPIADVDVTLSGKNVVERTGASGLAEFRDLPAGAYTIRAQRDGYIGRSSIRMVTLKPDEASVKAGENAEVRVQLIPTGN